MKKIFIIMVMAPVLFMLSGTDCFGQYKVNTVGEGFMVTGKDGSEIINISAAPQKNRFSVEVLGMQVQFRDDGQAPAKSVISKPRIDRGHFAFLEFGVHVLNDVDYYMYDEKDAGFMKKSDWKSFQWAFTFAKLSTDLDRSGTVSLAMALQWVFDDFVMDNNISLQKSGGMMVPVRADKPYDKSKLFVQSLRIPVVMELNFEHDLFISFGAYVSMVTNSNTKVKKPVERVENPYINPFQAGIMLKIGWRNYYFYGNSNITNLFKDGRGPMLTYFSYGIGVDF